MMMPHAVRVRRWLVPPIAALCLLTTIFPVTALAQRYEDFTTPRPLPPKSYLIIGILGGVERWSSDTRPVNRLASELREKRLPNVYVETVEHIHTKLALRLVMEALDRNGDGTLDDAERASARIILYGHSMGAAAAVKLARELNKLKIPVLLTVQVDSIGTGDSNIPSNVARAANFYQNNSLLLRGVSEIRADDPEATTIVGNFKYDYKHKKIDLSDSTPVERAARSAHTKMEFDPAVWSAVEELIMKEIK